jgi:hypothetical protein
LLLLFGLVSYGAVLGKSPTFDEPLNAVGGFVKLRLGDHRVDQGDPALFGYLAAFPHAASDLTINVTDPNYVALAADSRKEWRFASDALFHTPPPDGEVRSAGDGAVPHANQFINESRLVFAILALGLGGVMCWWAWTLAGPTAAVVATVLFALDPTFLAHAPLVKNDVLFAALLLCLAYAVWEFGRAATLGRFVVIGVICAAALNIKYSAVLFAPIVVILLAGRACLAAPWRVGWGALDTVRRRLTMISLASVLLLGAAWAGTWAIYGFRFAPMSRGALFDPAFLVDYSAASELALTRANSSAAPPTLQEVEAKPPSMVVRATLWMMIHRVLPQAWLNGFLYTYASTIVRPSYLLGNVSETGWWYYFPLALLFKTPLATLIAAGIALAVWLRQRRARQRPAGSAARVDRWTTLCLLVPPGIYAASAFTSHLNIGVRHVLPLYPFAFIGIGLVAAKMMATAARPTRLVCGALALLLTVETGTAFPNYIPFFNLAARNLPGADGGLGLLGDSNIDWGQDLPLLAEWQKHHHDRPLYLSYFGSADPQYYGVRYTDLPYGYPNGEPTAEGMDPSAYLAISAMNLQGTESGDFYRAIREGTPMGADNLRPHLLTVLGGTIYVYEWAP